LLARPKRFELLTPRFVVCPRVRTETFRLYAGVLRRRLCLCCSLNFGHCSVGWRTKAFKLMSLQTPF